MKKTTKIIKIVEEIKKRTHLDSFALHSIMVMYWIEKPSTRYNIIDSLIEACIIVKIKNWYKVVQHEEYNNI